MRCAAVLSGHDDDWAERVPGQPHRYRPRDSMHPAGGRTEDDRIGPGVSGQLGKLARGIAAALHQLHRQPSGVDGVGEFGVQPIQQLSGVLGGWGETVVN